jgi:hypothetical protein
VNAFRIPVSVFTSSAGLDPTVFARRTDGSIALRFDRATMPFSNLGYFSPLAPELPPLLGSVEVTLRGSAPVGAVRIGVRDRTGREPKVRLKNYVGALSKESWQVARIPLEAFRAAIVGLPGKSGLDPLGALSAVTVSLDDSAAGGPFELELSRVELVPDRAPLMVANFDADPPGQTSIGGKIVVDSRNGARLDLQTPAGKSGAALGVEISGGGNDKAYGLIVFGLGRIDAGGYKSLSFWVRGKSGGESCAVVLSDGKSKGKVRLSEFMKVDLAWQKALIPLSAFGKKLQTRSLRELALAWEGSDLVNETMIFDDFRFE